MYEVSGTGYRKIRGRRSEVSRLLPEGYAAPGRSEDNLSVDTIFTISTTSTILTVSTFRVFVISSEELQKAFR